ncbi:Clp protease N-terminal domain-containing protein [Ensifer canadensis]
MFNRIKQRFNDMGTIRALCERAEYHALQDQQREPGAEHFLLSALDLSDGTARRAFARVDADASEIPQAIARQYAEALRTVGLDPRIAAQLGQGQAPLPRNHAAYIAAPSGEHVMRALAADRTSHGPLLGADVVAKIADLREGVTARALRTLGVDPDALKAAAVAEGDAFRNASKL